MVTESTSDMWSAAVFDNGGCFVVYEPGNGTRYVIYASAPLPKLSVGFPLREGSRVVALLNFQRAMVLSEPTTHWGYIAEKLGLGEPDARALEPLFSEIMRGSFDATDTEVK